ncbi:hypothetical protein [Microbacterium sp. 13-71-7]|jgi:hypothetical protein|uniref:hypothetical protein n=1 Tax=Microbacterium sp. 13-71-7 TaxID=1970399 RepID=UPI000BC41A86|nr:hypothetical protein [Microbacterium sp. 13-71-7]OZB80072.1 MAG: hypothetical protein B7X32_20050 [Microbacterium sp. 13-71-7]
MNGPVLSGGVIVLVAALLWLLYFLPSWRGQHQYDAAERNALRLNRALRVLAETSEAPREVQLELNARTALAQQKLAKRLQTDREQADLQRLREQLAATHADPAFRRARARRRTRLTATVLFVLALGAVGLGVWQLMAAGSSVLLWAGGAVALLALLMLQRMATVARRAARRAVRVVAQPEAVDEPSREAELHDQGPRTWTPRTLPEPLVSVAGSRAHAARATIDAQTLAREAARAAELQRKADEIAPPAPTELPAPAAAQESPYARMGYVDDAEIEAHVRQLLAQRAAG